MTQIEPLEPHRVIESINIPPDAVTDEEAIAERFEKMRRVRRAFDANWHTTRNEISPSAICPTHNISRSVHVEQSLAEAWIAQDFKVVFRRCGHCVADEIAAQKKPVDRKQAKM